MSKENMVPVLISVTLWVHPDADIQEIVSEMDYQFNHDSILDSEITDINTEV